MEDIGPLIDPNLKCTKMQIKDEIILLHVEARNKSAICPFCQLESHRVHSWYIKKVQDLPIQGKKVLLLIKRRKMLCDNPECSHRTFVERFNLVEPKRIRSKSPDDEILNLCKNMNANSAAKLLRNHIAMVGKSTLCNMLKKEISIHKSGVTLVYLDDFALKRRKKYGTVMVDLITGKIIDMLPSRDPKDVTAWLEKYPHIKLCSRDGSQSYAKAIKDAQFECIQMSDRFHLLRNLTDAVKRQLKERFRAEFAFARKS